MSEIRFDVETWYCPPAVRQEPRMHKNHHFADFMAENV